MAAVREAGPGSGVTVFLRPVGEPLTLGLFGLAVATSVLASLQFGWVQRTQGGNVALILIGFAAINQFTAAVVAFLSRDGVTATAMAVLATTWLTVGLVLYTSPPGATSGALGIFLLVSGLAIALSGGTAALSKLVPAVVFLVAGARYVTTGVYELLGIGAWQYASAVIGLVLAVLAMYAAWAAELEAAVGRSVLPMGRRNKGAVAVGGDMTEQVRDVATEPGVRAML